MKNDLFENAGLGENEANCYRLLLEKGELSPPEVGEKLSMSRQNAYTLLAQLEKKGLAKKDERHNKLRYSPASPEVLDQMCIENIRLLENGREEILDAMPELHSLYNLAKDKPGISTFRGTEGIQKLYEDTLKKSPSEILLILSEKGKSKYMMTWIERHFRPERIARRIGLREIVNTDEKHDKEQLASLLWEKRFVDMPEMPRNMDMLIYDDNVTFIKYNRKEPFGFTIDDTLVYYALRSLFETCWNK